MKKGNLIILARREVWRKKSNKKKRGKEEKDPERELKHLKS